MLLIEWTKEDGWHSPVITPYGPLPMQPAASVFHYGSEVGKALNNISNFKVSVWGGRESDLITQESI